MRRFRSRSRSSIQLVSRGKAGREINAFALPGGFFYVNSGLILAADKEAELAGVMAHEIAHGWRRAMRRVRAPAATS